MKRPKINWKNRLADLAYGGGVLLTVFGFGGVLGLLEQAFVEGAVWAWCILGAIAVVIACFMVWDWLVQDDFGDRA